MSFISNITDRFVITPIAKRMTAMLGKQNSASDAEMPRQFAVPWGANSFSLDAQRKQMGSVVTVDSLRRLSIAHETTRAAINVRKRQINQLMWSVIDTDPDGGPSYSDEERLKIKHLFEKIGGEGVRFSELLNKLIEDVLVIDGLCFYKQRTRGGKLLRILPIDSGTIKIRVDESGMRPEAPEVAFEQWIRGVKVAEMTSEDMVYESMNPRTNSAFGLSPIETLILTIDASLRATLYNVNYLSDNNIPPGFITAPPEWTTQQVKEYKEFFDAAMSGSKAQSRIFMIPSGATYSATSRPKDFQFGQFFDYLDRKVSMLFDVTPQELGLSLQQYKENADSQDTIQMRKGLKPLAHFVEEIFTDIIQNDWGYADLAFRFQGLDSKYSNDDAKMLIPLGVISVDDVRIDRGEKPLGVDPFVLTAGGAIPVKQIAPTGVATMPGQEPTTVSGSNQPAQSATKEPPEPAQKRQMTEDEELEAWEKKAINDIHKRGHVHRRFVALQIPIEKQFFIKQGLQQARTTGEVRQIFKGKKIRRNRGLEALEGDKRFGQFKNSVKSGVLAAIKPFTDKDMISRLVGSAEKIAKADDINVDDYFESIDITGLEDYLKWAAQHGGQQALDSLGIGGTFELSNPDFQDMLGDRSNYLINSVDETTKQWLINQISEGKDQGLTNAEIADQIAQNDEDFSDARSNTIVNTEVANAMQTSELSTYQDQGVEKKTWVTSEDDLVDPICADLDGQVVGVEDNFSSGDDAPPAHPNCRCYIQAVTDDALLESIRTGNLKKDWATINGNHIFIGNEDMENKAISQYGTTKNPESAGFITRGGKMIDSSGKKQGSQTEGRNVDHREIAMAAMPDEFTGSGTDALVNFMDNTGAIRVHDSGDQLSIDSSVLPTSQQFNVLGDMASGARSIYADISEPSSGNTIASDEFKNFDKFQSWITNHFSSSKKRFNTKVVSRFIEKDWVTMPNGAHVLLGDDGSVESGLGRSGGIGTTAFNIDSFRSGSQESVNDKVNKEFSKDFPNEADVTKDYNWKVASVKTADLAPDIAAKGDRVDQYVKDMKSGAKFPPLMALQIPGEAPILLDGAHRLEAVSKAGAKTVDVLLGSPK